MPRHAAVPRRGPPSPAGPRRGESVREWYFGLGGPARYRVTISDGAVPQPLAVWSMSPGEAIDAVIAYLDSTERVNVRGAPAHVEEIGRRPKPDDLKATDEGWPFRPPPRLRRFGRQDIADSLIFISVFAVAGAVLGSYAFAAFSLLDGEWLRAVIAAGIATVPATGLAALWLTA
jgi:hypothetical protein